MDDDWPADDEPTAGVCTICGQHRMVRLMPDPDINADDSLAWWCLTCYETEQLAI
jgi:hypothetical protein